jgi:hypothetical protein
MIRYRQIKLLGLTVVYILSLNSSLLFAATPPTGLDLMKRFNLLPKLKTGVRCQQFSSYDRVGNNDDGYAGTYSYLYMDGSEYVLFESSSPGCIYNIWATRTTDTDFGTLKFYFDGETNPRINMTFDNLFSGTNAPFLSPLVGTNLISSGGWYCYLPIQFKKSLKISCTYQPRYWHMTYHLYDSDANLTSFTGTETSSDVITMWNNTGTDPKPSTGNLTVTGTVSINSGQTVNLADLSGPGEIESIKLQLPQVTVQTSGCDITDDGRAHQGYSQFKAVLDPANTGIIIRRRFDYGITGQQAKVYIDGSLAGTWISSNTVT